MSKPAKQQTKKLSIRDCLISMCDRIDQWDDNQSIPASVLTRLVADARAALKRFREDRKATGGMAKSPGRPVNEKLRLAIMAEPLDRKPELVASKVGCSSKHVRNVRKEAISGKAWFKSYKSATFHVGQGRKKQSDRWRALYGRNSR